MTISERDLQAWVGKTWDNVGGAASAQTIFLATRYSLHLIGANSGTIRIANLRTACDNATVAKRMYWYTKARGLDNGPDANEASWKYSVLAAASDLARVSYPAGDIVHDKNNGWDVVNLLDATHHAHWVTNREDLITEMMGRADLEGMYFDNAGVMIVTGTNSYVTPGPPAGYTDASWYAATLAFITTLATALTGAGKETAFNTYTGFAVAGQRGLSLLSSGGAKTMFSEGCFTKDNGTGTPGYWVPRSRLKQQIDDSITALKMSGSKTVVAIADFNQGDIDRRMFLCACFMLTFQNNDRLKVAHRCHDIATNLPSCPEYFAAVSQGGAPLEAYQDDGTFLTRRFTDMRVIVNPDSSSHVYTLPDGTWEQLSATGLVSLGAGSAFWQAAPSSVTMAANSALIIRQIGSDTRYTITSGGLARFYSLYLPTPLPPGRIPLLVMLHGGSVSADWAAGLGFNAVADANGFAVMYPDGTPDGAHEFWNSRGNPAAPNANVDDVSFLRAAVADAATKTSIDLGSVYFVGFSNGGKMSDLMADQAPASWAGVVSISGSIFSTNTNTGTIPYLHIHGDADTVVPYAGGPGSLPDEDFPNLPIEGSDPTADVMAYWATRNGGTTSPTSTTPTGYTKRDYSGAGETTWLYKMPTTGEVPFGGHSWHFGATNAPFPDANLPGGSTQAAVWSFLTGRYRAPIASLTATPSSGAATLFVALDGSGSTSLDGVLEYAFDHGTGSFDAYQAGATSAISFSSAGSKTVRLKVRDWAQRESAIVTQTVTVSAAVPTVTLSAVPTSGPVPLDVAFTAAGSGGAGAPFTYSFDFGEGSGFGSYSSTATPSHTYSAQGSYTAQVRAKDTAGTVSSNTPSVLISAAVVPPVGDPTLTFTASKYTLRRFERITLTWTSTNCVTVSADGNWHGAMPLNQSSYQFVPTRTGQYQLVLIGANSVGVTVIRTVTLTVLPMFGLGGGPWLGVPG